MTPDPHNTFVEKKLEEFEKAWESDDLDTSWFPMGGDSYDFSEENAKNFLRTALFAAIEHGQMDAARRIGQAATSAGLTPAELTSGDNWKAEVAHLKAAAHDEGLEHGREEGRKKKHWVHKSTLHTLEEKIRSRRDDSDSPDNSYNAGIRDALEVLQEIRKIIDDQ